MFHFKTRPAFPRRHALICQAALSSFDALSQATIHHASHCGNSCWSQQSLEERLVAPFYPPHAFLLYSPILLPATDPHCRAWTPAQLPSSLPLHPMTGPLCYNLRFGRFLLQFIKLTVLRWGNLKGFPPCNSTPLQQRPTSYPQFCCRLFIDLHALTEVLFFTLVLI